MAVEILDVFKLFGVSEYDLENIGLISMKLLVNKKLICVELSFGVLIQNKEILKSLNQSTANNINAISMDIELATV